MLALGERRPKKAYSHIEASVLSDCCQILGAAVSRANLVIRARQSERLAISGMVNATLAHEIRNALSSIRTFSEAVESGSTTPADLEALASATTDQVTRAEQMLSQMLLAVSPTNATRELIDVNLSVKRSIAAVAGKIRKAGIFLNLRLNPEPLFALAHTGLDNCVINLLGNAIDATQEYPDREPRIEVSTAKQDNSVQILVADNGPGIPESIRARLFEPFATTKSKGTGLGLMFSRKLVESLDGTLTIETVDRPGATFAIRLPIPITID
jgi:signal transduction histidine kinase